MISPSSWRIIILIGWAAALATSPAFAQLALPGAAPDAPAEAAAVPHKAKKGRGAAKADKTAKTVAAEGAESIDGRPLLLNGGAGQLQLSGQGATLKVDKLSLAGEGVSDPSQRCVVNIVGETPVVATSVGRPDGLDRYEVEVPACPFAFDVVDGAVLVPAQITACVFKAADCQTSPSGLWGPDGAALEADAAAIAKRRDAAENAMARALRALQARADGNSEAADLVRDQAGFAGQRDDTCRDYVKEAAHGFCAAAVTAARAALLEARVAALESAGGKSAKSEGAKAEKRAKAEKKAKSEKAAGPKTVKPAEGAPAAQPQ